MTDDAVRAALSEFHAVALTLYGEASGEPIEGRVFVGCVARNRLNSGRYGSDYKAVVHKRLQFSCWWIEGGRSNFDRVMALARQLLEAEYAERTTFHRDPVFEECAFLTEGLMGGQIRDRAKGATHYCTRALYQTDPPHWTKGRVAVVKCGAHVGFRL